MYDAAVSDALYFKCTTLSLFLNSLFPKTEIPYICEMLPLEKKQSGGKLLPQSDLQGGVFLEEMSCRCYNKKVVYNEFKVYGLKT